MICYVDTSALVSLYVKEGRSAAMLYWYTHCKDELVSSVWCVAEFSSALGIKQRTGQLTSVQAADAWLRFERLYSSDLRLLPAEPAIFHRAASMARDASTGLRAGDSVHLASALEVRASRLLTLDGVFARNAMNMKIALVSL